MKLFVPAVGYRILLSADWAFNLYYEKRNETLMEALQAPEFKTYYVDNDWKKGLRHLEAVLPAETLLEVDRVYVRTMNKAAEPGDDFDSMTFKILSHPKMPGNKKKLRFWAKLCDVNNIEYELPPDHTAGKDKAKEDAKKPKKLTPDKLYDLLQDAVRAKLWKRDYKKVPAWFTDEFINQCKLIEAEFIRVMTPLDEKQHVDTVAKHRAELELQVATGKIYLPIALATRVKTVEDLLAIHPHYGDRLKPFDLQWNNARYSWDRIVIDRCASRYGSNSTSKFEREPDGTCCRTFRPSSPNERSWNQHNVDMTHCWLRVWTNASDTEIVKVAAGVDSKQ